MLRNIDCKARDKVGQLVFWRFLSRCRLAALFCCALLAGCFPDSEDSAEIKRDKEQVSGQSTRTESQINRDKKSSLLNSSAPNRSTSKTSSEDEKREDVVATASPTNANIRLRDLIKETDPNAPFSLDVPSDVVLSKFYNALRELEAGQRQRPVTILHLGDGHIASDRLTDVLRTKFQARFGDSGRGLVMPGFPFPFSRAQGLRFEKSGTWTHSNILKEGDKGPYGLTGVVLRSHDSGATFSATLSQGQFSWAEIAVLTGADQGSGIVTIHQPDGQTRNVLSTAGPKNGVNFVRLNQSGTKLEIITDGGKPLSILSLRFGHDRPGVRYANLGVPKAEFNILQHMDGNVLRTELKHLKPDLIILGYGTNEGLRPRFDTGHYRARLIATLGGLKHLAPHASLLLIGPPDIANLPNLNEASKRSLGNIACRALSQDEKDSYESLLKRKDSRLSRWHPPPNLREVRRTLSAVASVTGSHYWDWSAVMGGTCGSHAWAHASPPLMAPNHMQFTEEGARRSAEALFNEIMSGYATYGKTVTKQP